MTRANFAVAPDTIGSGEGLLIPDRNRVSTADLIGTMRLLDGREVALLGYVVETPSGGAVIRLEEHPRGCFDSGRASRVVIKPTSRAYTRLERVLELHNKSGCSQAQIAAQLDCTRRTIQRDLKWLRAQGYLPPRE